MNKKSERKNTTYLNLYAYLYFVVDFEMVCYSTFMYNHFIFDFTPSTTTDHSITTKAPESAIFTAQKYFTYAHVIFWSCTASSNLLCGYFIQRWKRQFILMIVLVALKLFGLAIHALAWNLDVTLISYAFLGISNISPLIIAEINRTIDYKDKEQAINLVHFVALFGEIAAVYFRLIPTSFRFVPLPITGNNFWAIPCFVLYLAALFAIIFIYSHISIQPVLSSKQTTKLKPIEEKRSNTFKIIVILFYSFVLRFTISAVGLTRQIYGEQFHLSDITMTSLFLVTYTSAAIFTYLNSKIFLVKFQHMYLLLFWQICRVALMVLCICLTLVTRSLIATVLLFCITLFSAMASINDDTIILKKLWEMTELEDLFSGIFVITWRLGSVVGFLYPLLLQHVQYVYGSHLALILLSIALSYASGLVQFSPESANKYEEE